MVCVHALAMASDGDFIASPAQISCEDNCYDIVATAASYLCMDTNVLFYYYV